MIVYDLSCEDGHRFEGWFGSSNDFADQKAKGLLCCPQCGTAQVIKAPMAPAVPRKGNQQAALPTPSEEAKSAPAAPPSKPTTAPDKPQPMASGPPSPEAMKALKKLVELQAKALEKSTYVGEKFTDKSRAMHYGEENAQPIHGQASPEQAQELLEEGIAVSPLPFPVAKPDDLN